MCVLLLQAGLSQDMQMSWALNHMRILKRAPRFTDRGGQAPVESDTEIVDDRACRMMLLEAQSYRTLVRKAA